MVEGVGKMDSRPRLHGGRLFAGRTIGVLPSRNLRSILELGKI